jgi:spoIIIJ-associated protein
MSEGRTSLEIIAPTVEEAIERGAAQLGLPAEALEVEVLDEGGRGLLGIAARQARVRMTVRSGESRGSGRETAPPPAPLSPEQEEETVDVARAIVQELLERMGVEVQVVAEWLEPDEPEAPRSLRVDVRGRDLSILIGRRGETLASLQYIARLIVAKELDRMVPLVIDVEGYRARRERQLRQLARRMAGQAMETNRTVTLEPMPASERRIIHLELRNDEAVYTESIGEGDHRKVTIVPRKTD